MKHLTLPSTLVLTSALMTLACTAARAQEAIKEIGAPLTPPAALGTYGLDTPSRPGLKALTPPGWQLMVHKKVVLPSTVSWAADQTWLQAVGATAQKAGAVALVDWTTQTVYLQPAPSQEGRPAAASLVAPAAPAVPATPAATSRAAVPATEVVRAPVPPASPAPAQAAASGPAEASPATLASAGLLAPVPMPAPAHAATSEKTYSRSQAAQAERDLAAARAGAYREARAKSERLDPRVEYVEDSRGQVLPVRPAMQSGSLIPTVSAAPALVAPFAASNAPTPQPLPPVASRAGAWASGDGLAGAQPSTSSPAVAHNQAVGAVSSAVALNRPDHRQAAEQLAGLHGAYLDYQFAGQVRLPGPVTLIGADLGEDVRLLQQAMGPGSPVVLEYCRQPVFVRALPAGRSPSGSEASACQGAVSRPRQEAAAPPALSPVATQLRPSGQPFAAAPDVELGTDIGRVRHTATAASGVASPVAAAPAAAAAAPRAPALALRVEPGQDLEDALRSFLAGQGMRLSWESASAFAPTELVWERTGPDVVEVLRKLLPALGLEAEVNFNDKTVRVTDRANQVRG